MQNRSVEAIHIERARSGLPKPVASYTGVGARFEVYRTKDMHRSRWHSAAEKEIATLSRKSYDRYGSRPLFDAYDKKAAIYAVRASYAMKGNTEIIEEWLSIRMVPGDGAPRGVREPEIYRSRGKSVDYWMKQKMGADHFWNHVVSSSRMCGIHPYAVTKKGKVSFLKDARHRYTSVCFVLIHKQFGIDYPRDQFPYRVVTALIRPDFYEKGLVYRSRQHSFRPVFTPANNFLSFKKNEIKVKRDVYSWKFPLYWFDAKKLLATMNELRQQQKLPPLEKLSPDMLQNLAKKSDRQIPIAGIRTKPAHLRALIDKKVPDMPELKITPAGVWYGGMDAFIKALKVVPYVNIKERK